MQPERRWTKGISPVIPSEGLHETVARNVSTRPDAIALRSEGATTSYEELDRTADAWAAALASEGVGPGDCVPVVLPKSAKLIEALLAVLKTGAAYALLDPGWPASRLADLVDQLDAPLVVTVRRDVGSPGRPGWAPPEARGALTDFRAVSVDGSDACCVFFTSGTTGRPKAVLTPHRATARLFARGTFVKFDPTTVIPLAAAMPWDAFSLELWSALLTGGTSWLVDEPYLSGAALRRGREAHGVTTVWLTSSLFNMLVDEDLDAFDGVREVMIGGERLSPPHVARFLRRHPASALLNGYGPVESTVFATTHRIVPDDCERPDGIPLGRPVPGTTVVVLDGERECEVGETGEICIAGDGLALGYVRDPDATAERFPYVELDGERVRVYRTADLGAWGEDGLLRYRGREDRQLKIRGHRIEPADVERQVERLLPAVRSCRVLPRRDEQGTPDALVAFCVPSRPGDPLPGALQVLRSELLPHQRPVAVVTVDRFPVTEQGKLDERALLVRAEAATRLLGRAAGAPSRRMARAVASTVAEVLGLDEVPVDVSLFELGGDSLDAGRVCARLTARLARPVPVSRLYEHPTVEALASWLDSAPPAAATLPTARPDEVPLTPMQLVFLTRHLADPSERTGYCLLTWELRGDVDRGALEAAVAAVHVLHEPLRAAYLPDPTPHARLADVPPPSLKGLAPEPTIDAALDALRADLARQLEPLEGRVWRTALVPVGAGQLALFGCVVHHIAFDGWSEAVLARDLAAAYNAARGAGPALRSSPSSLAAADVAHAERVAYGAAAGHRASLLAELSSVPDLHWPEGADAPPGASPKHLELLLPREVVVAAEERAAAAGATRFVALLSAWVRALAEATSQHDFALGVPVAQRDHPLLESAVGCHISIVCFRLRDAALDDGLDGLRELGSAVSRTLAAQDVSLRELFGSVSRSPTRRPPVFQTLFAVQGNEPPQLELSGLRTAFLRQPYLAIPLELHAELWPDELGGMLLVVSYRPDTVSDATARECATRFAAALEPVVAGSGR